MRNSKSFTNVVTRKPMKAIFNVSGVQFFRLQIQTKISHSLGLQKSTTYEIQLHEMVV